MGRAAIKRRAFGKKQAASGASECGLREFLDFNEGDAGGGADAADLGGVAAGVEVDDEDGVFGAGDEAEGADASLGSEGVAVASQLSLEAMTVWPE